jgi:Flp pilus assembly protein TadG
MRTKLFREERGQMLLWVALAMPILILMTAMAVDMGIIYMTKARLANAVDAAVLTGVKTVAYWTSKDGSVSSGQADAQRYAAYMFAANFGSSAPTQSFAWCPGDPSCPPNTTSLQLRATTKVNTTFMSYLPQWAQWTVGATSTAQRGNLVMSLVLDRSGSMCGGSQPCDSGTGDGGGDALKGAVPAFVQNFAEGTDHIAMISFASNSTVGVPMTQSFTNPVKTAVNAMRFTGGTFGTGAGTNTGWSTSFGPPLSMADNQNSTVTFPAGTAVTKAVVYFTDGLMNTVQDTFKCPATTLLNYGGHDSPDTQVDSLDPRSATTDFGCYGNGCGLSGLPYDTRSDVCMNGGPVTTFPSQKFGAQVALNRDNVTKEAQYRALYTAGQMRQETPISTYIYVIGLGSKITDFCTSAFLSTLANDPDGPAKYPCPASPARYDASMPPGLFLQVPNCPSPTCTQSLSQAFQVIAGRILLRLSQ